RRGRPRRWCAPLRSGRRRGGWPLVPPGGTPTTPPEVIERPKRRNSRAILVAETPHSLFSTTARATARGPRWQAAAPRATEDWVGWRPRLTLLQLRQRPRHIR